MSKLFRDTTLGKVLRLLSGQRILKYPEEIDPSLIKDYLKVKAPKDGENDLFEELRGIDRAPPLDDVWDGDSTPDEKAIDRISHSHYVDWIDENDPENPQNWSNGKKLAVSGQIWLLTFSIYIGSAIYSSAEDLIAEYFGVSTVVATIGLTCFVFGYGLGPMIWSPLSEIPPVGRTPVYVLTLCVFVFFQFGVIYAKNIGMLLAFRFLTGFIGSPALATGAASMGDIWGPRVRDYMIGIWGVIAVLGPLCGPMVGGFASAAKGWQWSIWPLMWISGLTFVLTFCCLPETLASNILTRRARRVRRILGHDDYQSLAEIEAAKEKKSDLIFEALVRPFQLGFGEPIVFFMNMYCALIYGTVYIFLEAFPVVFIDIHGFNSGENGLAFLGLIVATFVVIPLYFLWKWKHQTQYYDENDDIAPEHQMPAACVGALLLPVSLFWFGWTGGFVHVHWIVPIIGSSLFGGGACLIFNSIFTYQGGAYPKFAASVLAGNDFMRSSMAAGFPLFATQMFENLGIGWAGTLLGCLCIVFIPIPYVLYFKGKQIRMKSNFARHDI